MESAIRARMFSPSPFTELNFLIVLDKHLKNNFVVHGLS